MASSLIRPVAHDAGDMVERIQASHWRLACFDLDGTLVRGTTTCQHIANVLGHGTLLMDLERRYASGEISNRAVAEADGGYYAGRTVPEIAKVLTDIPLIRGIAATVAKLDELGIPSLICTVTWRFAAEVITKNFGFVSACGTEMEIDSSERLTGAVSRHFDEFDKRSFVEAYCLEHKIPLSRVFAVGDSRSDVPLFGAVGFSIALNATAEAEAAASTSVASEDLTDILQLVPGLITTQAVERVGAQRGRPV
jgi:phosphoserine phosphatase